MICGTVSVPEDYEEPDGRRVPLAFALGRAHSTKPLDDAIVYLHGGPASGALSYIGSAINEILGGHRERRDVATFDQRAAMLSQATLRCNDTVAENIVDIVHTIEGAPTPDRRRDPPRDTRAALPPAGLDRDDPARPGLRAARLFDRD